MVSRHLELRSVRSIDIPRLGERGFPVHILLSLLLLWIASCSGVDLPPIPPAEIPRVTAGFVPGDVFEVEVYDEEALGGEFQVQDDGSIDFPLVGRLELLGKTQAEVARIIEERLADGFLRNPQVKIVVTTRQNFEVSVLGQVSAPGTFPWVDRLSLIQAISNAGGLTPLAARKRIRLTRKLSEGGHATYQVSLKAITAGEASDPLLQPGDIVFVPEMKI